MFSFQERCDRLSCVSDGLSITIFSLYFIEYAEKAKTASIPQLAKNKKRNSSITIENRRFVALEARTCHYLFSAIDSIFFWRSLLSIYLSSYNIDFYEGCLYSWRRERVGVCCISYNNVFQCFIKKLTEYDFISVL